VAWASSSELPESQNWMSVLPLTKKPASSGPVPRPTSIYAAVDDTGLVEAVRRGHPAAKAELFDRYVHHVQRVLARILGGDQELADLLHEVFVRALGRIGTLEAPERLKSWLTGVAVLTARECLHRRWRGRWLRFLAAEDVPEIESSDASEEIREALRVTYAILDRLGTEDRIVFTLRFLEGLEVTDVASACGMSLNTVKRRIARAERRFLLLAERERALEDWLDGGARWPRT
jgi:RNA polymerase sigma-70 factor (ECF subfamily)